MGIREWARAVSSAACVAATVFAPAQADHMLIMRDGSWWSCQVKGVSNGEMRYVLDASATREIKAPCTNVLAFIDASMIVHADACAAAAQPPPASIKRNCASLIGKDHSVTKCDILQFEDDHLKVRTLQGDKNIPDSDVAVHLNADGDLGFERDEDLKVMFADANVVRMMNNTAQCPAAPVKVSTGYSPKRHAVKLKQEVGRMMEVNKLTARRPSTVRVDTTGRGTMKEPDFDDFDSIALYKVKRLEGYIGQMVNVDLSDLLRDDAVQGAVELFNSPTKNTVEVSNLRADGTWARKAHPVDIYFNGVLRRTRAQVRIAWSNMIFASDWEMQPDSSYRATISIQQTYRKELDGRVVYSDVTNKNVEVIAQAYDKFVEGKFEKWWDVFLGDIGVTSSSK